MKPILFCDVDGVIRARTGRTHSGNAHDYDPAKHFDMDQFTVFNERDYWEFHYSTEMVIVFRELIESGQVEFMWNSNWRNWAISRLNPLFGFNETVTYLDIEYDKRNRTQDYKGHGIVKHLADTPDRPFIWLDDIATGSFLEGENENAFSSFTGDRLVIQTEERFGLTREHLSQIKTFLNQYN